MKKYKFFRGLNVLLGILAVVVVAIVGLLKSVSSEVYAGLTGETDTNNYLTFTAEEANSKVTFRWVDGTDVMYSTKIGNGSYTEFKNCSNGTEFEFELELVSIGDSVRFKGTSVTTSESKHFNMTGKIAASGDVTSLTNGTGGDAALSYACYSYMFEDCDSLVSVPNLPSTTLNSFCYDSMFAGCTSITDVSAYYLPATTLQQGCYKAMFKGCVNLISAPKLTAMADEMCYQEMFSGCKSLLVRVADESETPTWDFTYGLGKDWNKDMIANSNNILSGVEIGKKYIAAPKPLLTFDTNEGSVVPSAHALPIKNPTKDGYIFVGWNYYKNSILTKATDETIFTEDTTLYAEWIKKHTHGQSGEEGYICFDKFLEDISSNLSDDKFVGGTYALNKSVSEEINIDFNTDTTICLNGNSLNVKTIFVDNEATLTIYDCIGTGSLSVDNIYVTNGTINIYGGSVLLSKSGRFDITAGNLNVYGGNIILDDTSIVALADKGSELFSEITINGGTFNSNTNVFKIIKSKLKITGGTFVYDGNATEEKLVESDHGGEADKKSYVTLANTITWSNKYYLEGYNTIYDLTGFTGLTGNIPLTLSFMGSTIKEFASKEAAESCYDLLEYKQYVGNTDSYYLLGINTSNDKEIILYDAAKYTINLNYFGAPSVDPIYYRSDINFEPDASKYQAPEGKVFDHWATNTDGTGGGPYKATGELTIYAIWKDAPTITYESNGGSDVTSVTSATIVFPSDNPTKSGCMFAGWCTDEALNNAAVAGTSITEDTTLYAKWVLVITSQPAKNNNYTVGVDANITGVSYQWCIKNGTLDTTILGTPTNGTYDSTAMTFTPVCVESDSKYKIDFKYGTTRFSLKVKVVIENPLNIIMDNEMSCEGVGSDTEGYYFIVRSTQQAIFL